MVFIVYFRIQVEFDLFIDIIGYNGLFKIKFKNAYFVANEYLTSCSTLKFPLISHEKIMSRVRGSRIRAI